MELVLICQGTHKLANRSKQQILNVCSVFFQFRHILISIVF